MNTPGPYEAIVLADSIASGVRLTTLCCTFPRIVLAEFNTHRMLSRNSASSRAIPVLTRVRRMREGLDGGCYAPLAFGANQSGMQAKAEEVADTAHARRLWSEAATNALDLAEALAEAGVHKQWANRLIEPFAWHTVIVSATEWANFFALRIHEAAQPEIRKVAEAMKAAMDESRPIELSAGDWHTPLNADGYVCTGDGGTVFGAHEGSIEAAVKLSVARCAAISFERHMLTDVAADLARYDKLSGAGHMSPFEHAAVVGEMSRRPQPQGSAETRHPHSLPADADARIRGITSVWVGPFIGNFRAPWIQQRKLIPGEAVFGSAS